MGYTSPRLNRTCAALSLASAATAVAGTVGLARMGLSLHPVATLLGIGGIGLCGVVSLFSGLASAGPCEMGRLLYDTADSKVYYSRKGVDGAGAFFQPPVEVGPLAVFTASAQQP